MTRPEHLPLELLQTFTLIADLDGDATAAAERLGITQPSISKRLTALRRVTSDPDRQPWLILKGRRWRLTTEGQRVRGVVADLVRRYEQMEQFVASARIGRPVVTLACGQQAASGFVRRSVERFLNDHPECQVRISTPRGKARIEGVAGGQFDFALVTDNPTAIHRMAQREMYVEPLFEDRFVLAAHPRPTSLWGMKWCGLPTNRPLTAAEVIDLPFILPEPDAYRRQQFDEWCFRATGKTIDAVVETGGWQTILDFVESGIGVGLVTHSAITAHQTQRDSHLTTRLVTEKEFPPDAVRLIARKMHGKEEAELTEQGNRLRRFLWEQTRS